MEHKDILRFAELALAMPMPKGNIQDNFSEFAQHAEMQRLAHQVVSDGQEAEEAGLPEITFDNKRVSTGFSRRFSFERNGHKYEGTVIVDYTGTASQPADILYDNAGGLGSDKLIDEIEQYIITNA